MPVLSKSKILYSGIACGLPWKEQRRPEAVFWERSIKDGFMKDLSERKEKTMTLRHRYICLRRQKRSGNGQSAVYIQAESVMREWI